MNCYSRALEVDEKHCDAFVARGKNFIYVNLYKFFNVSIWEKRYNEALNCYSRALEVDEKHCDAFVARGKNLYLYKFK